MHYQEQQTNSSVHESRKNRDAVANELSPAQRDNKRGKIVSLLSERCAKKYHVPGSDKDRKKQ